MRMTRDRTRECQTWTIGLARLVLVAAAALFVLSGPGTDAERSARAIEDQVGAVTFTVDRTADGTGAKVRARAADGVLIFDLQAHLCVGGSGVRTFYDFGFSGKKCTNAPVGGSDVEQRAKYPDGTTTAELPVFRLGQGTTQWSNADGFDREISCLPEAPCDLVVLAQITRGEAIYTAPLCFTPACPPGTVGGADPDDPPPPVPTTAAPPVAPVAEDPPGGAAAGGTRAAGSAGGAGSARATGDGAGGSGSGSDAEAATSAPSERRASTVSVGTPTGGPSQAVRVRAAAAAGLAGGALIVGLVGRGRRMLAEPGAR
jgi:hypothetical protein